MRSGLHWKVHEHSKSKSNDEIRQKKKATAGKRGHSSAGRASALQAEGRRFDPDWLHQIQAHKRMIREEGTKNNKRPRR